MTSTILLRYVIAQHRIVDPAAAFPRGEKLAAVDLGAASMAADELSQVASGIARP
jgi:hypothetical protein